MHFHKALTSGDSDRRKAAVTAEAAIKRNRRCVLGSVDLFSLMSLLWRSLTTTLCRQTRGDQTNTRGWHDDIRRAEADTVDRTGQEGERFLPVEASRAVGNVPLV